MATKKEELIEEAVKRYPNENTNRKSAGTLL